jgi:hypothetical protein
MKACVVLAHAPSDLNMARVSWLLPGCILRVLGSVPESLATASRGCSSGIQVCKIAWPVRQQVFSRLARVSIVSIREWRCLYIWTRVSSHMGVGDGFRALKGIRCADDDQKDARSVEEIHILYEMFEDILPKPAIRKSCRYDV